jgi:hypothetical protein
MVQMGYWFFGTCLFCIAEIVGDGSSGSGLGIGGCGLCLVCVLRGFVDGLMNGWVGGLVLVLRLSLGLYFVLVGRNECVVGLAQRLRPWGGCHEGTGRAVLVL